MIKSIPENFHTLTPSFTFKNSERAIEFYKNAFGAELVDFFPNLDGVGTMHATIRIGNSMIMLGDEMPGDNCSKSAESIGTSPISLYLYVENVDTAFSRAVAAGGIPTMNVADMFWGDRVGQIKDPFGYLWMLATHTKDLNKEEMRQGAKEFFDK